MKSWENNGKRDVHKRFDMSQLEADLLRGKAEMCGMTEAQYIRELICSSQPREAPPREFYQACNDINKIGVNINQIAKKANTSGNVSQEDIDWMKETSDEILSRLNEIRKIVSRPRPYFASYYDKYAYACVQARKEGKPVPSLGANLNPPEKPYPDHPESIYKAVYDETDEEYDTYDEDDEGDEGDDISGQIHMSDLLDNETDKSDTEG